MTSPARTVVDVARTRPIRDALVVADAALRLRLATKDELEEVLEAARTWPGAPRARRVCRLADAGAESPGETLLRLDLLELGLVRFRLQVVVRGASGRRYRADVRLEDLGVIVEFDGELKYDGPGGRDALKAEKRREDDLRLAGWAVVRVSWSELGDRDRLRRKLQQATRLSHRRTAAS